MDKLKSPWATGFALLVFLAIAANMCMTDMNTVAAHTALYTQTIAVTLLAFFILNTFFMLIKHWTDRGNEEDKE